MAGFLATNTYSSSTYTGSVKTFSIIETESLNIAIGDVVLPINAQDSLTGLQKCQRLGANATATPNILGVVVGVDFDPSNLNIAGYVAGSGARVVQVLIDPEIEFDVDVAEATASSSTLSASSVGKNVLILAATGTAPYNFLSQITGGMMTSGMYIDGKIPTAAVGNPFTLVHVYNTTGGSFGLGRVRVRVNNSFYTSNKAH